MEYWDRSKPERELHHLRLKILSYLPLTILLSASGATYAADELVEHDFSKTSYLTQVYGKLECSFPNMHLCAQELEIAFQKSHGDLMHRDDNNLRIKLKDGAFFTAPYSGKTYQVLEAQANDRFIVIREQFSEGNTWHLLDRSTGKLEKIEGYPLFSPDMTKFVSAATDMEAGFSPTVFDVYAVTANGIARQYKGIADPNGIATWGGTGVNWIGNSKIAFFQISFDGSKEKVVGGVTMTDSVFNVRRATLEFVKDKWQLHVDEHVIGTAANVIW